MATQIPPSSNASAQTLWDQAFNSLGADLKTSLGQAATHKRDILAAALEAAETRKATSLRKRWKFKRSNGEVVIIRDVLEKIAKWIDSFKAVGDAAVQFDASNASLPWAAVRLLLQVTVNDVQQYGTMVQDLEVVSRIIARYKEFENLHLGRDEHAQPALETALTVLYTEVLTHLAQTIAFFSQSTAVRLAKSVFWTGNDGIQKILSREDEVLKLAKLQDTSDLRFIQKTVLRLRDQINSNTKRIEEEDYIKMISWMSTSPFSIHHETISDSRTPNFGQWLLKHEAYRNWCESSSSSTLWIHGITGSGKTNLFSVTVDSLQEARASQPESTPFAYFYCLESDSEPERSSADGILRSILRQLAITETQSDVRDFFYSDFQRRSRSAVLQGLDLPKLSRKECVDRIVQVANEDPITILLDGVEQVEEESCGILLQSLSDIMSKAENVVKVLVTSRNSLDILLSLPTAKEIIVTADHVHDDMARFITQKIDDAKLISGRLSPDKRSCLTKELLEGAGEMFLWAHRQIQQLRKVKNEHDLLPALQSNILSDLDTLYENDLGQILQSGDTSRQLAIQTFSWLLYMKSPLNPEALLAAVTATGIGDVPCTAADISAVCSNLVVIDLHRQVVRLAHHSVREFILRTKQSLFSASIAHSLLASTCIKVSARGPPDSGSLEQQVRGFFFYSATHWAGHFESSRVVKKEDKLFQDMISFVFEDEDYDVSLSFEAWLDTAKEIARLLPRDHPMKPALDAIPNATSSPLFLAAIFGMDGLLALIAESESNIDWDQRNDLGHTALYLAAATGHPSTVTALIKKGAELNVECGTYGSPLHVACFRGYQDIVEELLQHGASPQCGSKFQSAIQAASQGGHEDIVLSLIRHDIINSEDDYEQAMQIATEYGFIKVIDQLLKPEFKHFVEKDTPDKHKMRLAKAIKAGQLFVLQRQIAKAPPGAADTFPKDAVAIAALYGHTDMVKYLLEQGLDIEAEGQFGTPLRSACLMNRRSTVEELLKRGANINTEERKGNALYVAAAKGHVDIVRILLDEDADLHQKTGSCGTALHAAAYHGHRKVVEMLLDAGANVHAEDSSPDAFHAAAEGGHQNIIMLFLERGYRFLYEPPSPKYKRAQPSPYRPLYREVSPGRDKHPRSKLWPHLWKRTARTAELGSGTDARDNITRVETDDEMEMIATDQRNSLRDDENRQDGSRKNRPLTASAERGRDAVVVILLRQKETLGFMDYEVDAALKAAASHGHLNTVRILLDHALKMKGPFIQRVCSTLENIPEGRHDILQLTLAKAFESGCTEEQIDQLRLKLPPGKERYKVAVIEQQALKADLLECCTSGNVAVLEAIMSCKHQHLLQANDLLEGLQKAAERGHVSVIKSLFKLSSHLQRAEIPDNTLISAAGKDLEMLKFLLLQKVDISGSELLLSRLVYTTCSKGQPDIIEYLVSNFGIDVNANISEGEKPRRFRRMRQSADPRLTSTHITTTDGADGSTPANDSRLVSLLQVSLSAFDTYEMPYYSRWYRDKTIPQQQETIQTLLRLGADPNSLGGKDVYPLPYAARICPGVVVKELLEAGADVKLAGQGDLALLGAVQREMEAMEVMNRLLDNGHPLPDYFDRGKTLLDKVLNFFEGDRRRQTFHSIVDDPDGRFEQAPSLEYVFEEGPGAVLEFLLQKYDTGKLEDTRYGLVLQMACVLGRTPLVDLLLSRGVGVDATGYYYGSSLQAAARTGQLQIVKKLLNKGANPNVIQGRWHTSLHAAIVGGQLEIVQLLLQHGADPKLKFRTERQSHNERGLASSSTLQLALQEGHTEIARLLLDTDPSLIKEEGRLQHPLIISCQKGDHAMTELLLEASAPVNVRGHKEANVASMEVQDASPLHAAISGGHVNIFKALLLRGADANLEVDDCDCRTPLLAAIQKRDLIILRLLLDSGAKIDSSSLQRACRSGDLAIVEALFEQLFNDGGAPFEIIDETLESLTMEKFSDYRTLNRVLDYVPPTPKRFLLVCSSGSVPLVRRMIQQGMSVDGSDEEEDSPLQVACYYLNFEVVRLLLQRGAKVRSRSSQPGDPITLALWACALPLQQQLQQRGTRHQKYHAESADYRTMQRCTSIVRILLEYGATADGGTHEMESPLQLASFIGNLEISKLLIKHGASVDKITGSFKTPLFSAFQGNNNSDIVSLILEKGVDVNYVHPIHGSALHLASQYNDEPVVLQLLQHGASPVLKNANGVTALTLALESAASYYGASQNISRLICRHSTTLDITDSDIIAAARVEPSDLLSFLLDSRGEEPVTEDLVIRFLSEERRPSQENLEVLFDRSQGLEITPKMLSVGLSEQAFGSLTQARQLSVDITPDILESQTDLGTLKALIGYQPGVEVTEGLVIKILSIVPRYSRWWQREESTELLLSLWPRDLPLSVTNAMLKAATSLPHLELLLERLGSAQGQLQDVAVWICEQGTDYSGTRDNMLALVLKADPKVDLSLCHLEKIMLGAKPWMLDMVLTHMPSLPITEKIFLSIFREYPEALEHTRKGFAEVLARHQKKFVFTEKIREAIDMAYQKHSDIDKRDMWYSLREMDETPEEAEARQAEENDGNKNDDHDHPRDNMGK